MEGRAYAGGWVKSTHQKEFAKARGVYEYGTRATGSENAYLWQAFATLERKAGNAARGEEVFRRGVGCQSKHAAAWHGWGGSWKERKGIIKEREICF